MINWNIDGDGVLYVYKNNDILFEISDCKDMTDDDVNDLINEELKEKVTL